MVFKKGYNPWNKGKKHSEETLQKMRGKTPWNKGLTRETDERIGKGCFQKGHEVSEEIRKKISVANIGKKSWNKGMTKKNNPDKIKYGISGKNNPNFGKKHPHSKETKRKMKENNAHYWKGKKKSEETKEKMRGKIPWNKGIKQWENKIHPRGMLGKKNPHSEETNKKISQSNMGRIISSESRKKISKGLKKYFNQHPEAIINLKKLRSKIKFPFKDSTIEVKIQNFLKELGIEFFTHQYMKIKHSYRCDIFIPSINLIIEADGDYWHGNPNRYSKEELNQRQIEQKERDNFRTKELIAKGYNVIRIWEGEIRQMNIEQFKIKLKEVNKNSI